MPLKAGRVIFKIQMVNFNIILTLMQQINKARYQMKVYFISDGPHNQYSNVLNYLLCIL